MTDANANLARLRQEIDELDQRMIAIAARRCEVVRSIASAKAGDPEAVHRLFDRGRERAVYEKAEQRAREIGLEPRIAHQLMQAMVEGSHTIQEHAAQQTARTRAVDNPQRILIVGGAGRMGQLFERQFTARGHVVDCFDADDPRDRAEVAQAADIVIIAVPMALAESVAAEFAPLVREDALLCDINSLKQGVCEVMAEHASCEVVGLHPMFGPTVRTLRRQKVVVCPITPGPRAQWLHHEFEQMGVEIIESDPLTHDRAMAAVQVLVHFSTLVMGEALRSTGLSIEETLRFTSPIYRLEIAFIGRLFAQNADLYAEIEMTNPHGDEFRRRFLEAAGTFSHTIGNGDRESFRKLFNHVREYFHGFSAESMRLSDFIIDTLVMQP